MFNLIFGTPRGRKALYSSLLVCFILFTGFIYTAEVPATPAAYEKELALQGKQLWQKHNCVSCHQLYGLGGYLGPDLTNIFSAKGKGEAYARAILQHGTASMPDFKLSTKEIDAIVMFLKHADQTGKAARENFYTDVLGQIHPLSKPVSL